MADEAPEKEESAGAPLWMATFADLMSLLLAFFVLLFSFASMDDQRYAEIGGSMQDAFGMEQKINQEDLMGITQIEGTFSGGKPGMSILLLALNKAEEQIKKKLKINKSNDGGTYDEAPPEELMALASYLILLTKDDLLRKLLGDDKLEANMKVEFTERTFKVTLAEDTLFEPGSIELKESIDKGLKLVARLSTLVKGKIDVFGYTDNQPYSGPAGRSNLELSARRAVTVSDRLLDLMHAKPPIIKAFGRGSSEPVASNDTPEGRSLNRRVEIIIEHPDILDLALELLEEKIKEVETEKPKRSYTIPEYLMRVPSKVADPTNAVNFFDVNVF